MPFVQPPFTLLFISPLGYLSYHQARLVWFAINLLLILLLPYAFGRSSPGLLSEQRLLVLLVALSFYPFLVCLWQGQISLLFLWLVTGAYFLLCTGNDFWAGVLLGLAFIRFHLAYLLILPLILKWRKHALFGFAVSVGSLLSVSACWIGIQGFRSYVLLLHRMSKDQGELFVTPDKFQNWIGQLQLWGLNEGGRITSSIILGLLGASLMARIWRGPWRPQSKMFGLRFAASVMVALLMSPYLFIHDLSILFPVLVFCIEYLLGEEKRGWESYFILTLLLLSPLIWFTSLLIAQVVPIQGSVLWMSVLLYLLTRMIAKSEEFRMEQADQSST